MLKYLKGYICNGYTSVVNKEDVHNARDDMFVEATALLPADWISVKERLPETATVCVVLVSGNPYIMEYLYDNDKGFWNGELRDKPVTHWQPLPRPPREAQE